MTEASRLNRLIDFLSQFSFQNLMLIISISGLYFPVAQEPIFAMARGIQISFLAVLQLEIIRFESKRIEDVAKVQNTFWRDDQNNE